MLQALASRQYALILNAVPRSVTDVLECPPLQELINHGAKVNDLEACLAVEIAKVSNMLTVGGNLRQGQSVEIARALITDYPNESLQDFCLCLRNGMKGHYGEIFRFDIMVINDWFQKYLLQKYQAIEDKLMREKDEMYKPQTFSEEVQYQKVRERLAQWRQAVEGVGAKKIAPLTDEEIDKEGQEKPKANFHPYTSESQIRKHERHLEYLRQNYDKYTGDKLPTWMPEEKWNDANP